MAVPDRGEAARESGPSAVERVRTAPPESSLDNNRSPLKARRSLPAVRGEKFLETPKWQSN